MPEPIAVGVAGLGRAGWSLHCSTLGNMEQYAVSAVCDDDPARRKEAQDKHGCKAYATFDEMVADDSLELIVVAVPSFLHADYAIKAMRAGKHALVEKPFATNVADVDKMIAVSKETGKLVTCSQNYRYGADFLKVKEVVDSGVLGRIVHIRIAYHGFSRRWDWQTLKEFGGGSLNNTGPHPLDHALILFGDAKPEVTCHLEKTPLSLGDADDTVKVLLKAPGAPVIDVEVLSTVAFGQERWMVNGTQGGLYGGQNHIRVKNTIRVNCLTAKCRASPPPTAVTTASSSTGRKKSSTSAKSVSRTAINGFTKTCIRRFAATRRS
ncbi:MAG: Gfo/Idh/MocA family oxidoreductase [Candidatus Poribacteria bacterium]|nr:Gfo/Idh/MocA family oxidoreductase [Candidatus Poribacteria bacterium]